MKRRTVLASVRLESNGGSRSGHFNDSWELRLAFALRCARIFGVKQASCEPQGFQLFADPYQLLLFDS
jgi:hypothetical protein